MFSTIGAQNSKGLYHLEIKHCGHVRWFHRNEYDYEIFSVLTNQSVDIGKWVHLAVTYDGSLRMAKVG